MTSRFKAFIRDAPFESAAGATWEAVSPRLYAALQDAFKSKKFPILLSSPPGLGKTLAMACLYRTLPQSVYWWDAINFVRFVQQARRDGSIVLPGALYECSESSIWKTRIDKPHILFIDEIGLRNPSPSQYEIMYELINRRADKPTIYSTNKTLKELHEMFDARISSRLSAGTIIEIQGGDRRREAAVRVQVHV